MHKVLEKKGFIIDMDGVIYHGNVVYDGVKEFIEFLVKNDKKFILQSLFGLRKGE